jgi:tripeptidyl-peptidase-2
LISACKAEGIGVSPARIRRAMENTAKMFPKLSTLQQGWGMIQVDRAFEYLQAHKEEDTEDIYFDVRVENRSGNPRGIYLRQPEEANLRQTFAIGVDPQFRREDDISEEMQRRRIDFEMHFTIQSTAPWVKVPEHFMLMNNGRSFKVDVDPTGLELGVHTAKVCAYDSDKPDRKVVFSVPITVVRSYQDQPFVHLGELEFHPAEVKRFFVVPPPGSTWMDVTIRDTRDANQDGESTTKLIVLHTVQMLPHASYRDFEHEKYFHLLPSQTVVSSVAIEEGITCEVDLARYWSTIGKTKANVSIQFRGVRPTPNRIHMLCGAGGALVRVNSDLKDESVGPSAKLTKWMTPLRPKSEGVISPLGSRDILPSREKQIYQLVLTYEFTQEEKGAFTPRALALQDALYESAFESQMMLIFDGEKKYLGVADYAPSPVTAPKGNVTIRMQIRHDEPSKLEKLKDMAIWIQRNLEKDISLSTHATRESLTTGNASFRKRVLKKGMCVSVFFAEPPVSKLPSNYKSGDILTGTVNFASGDSSLPGDGKRPGGFEISYSVGPKPEKATTDVAETPEAKDERTAEEKMDEAVRDAKVAQLGKLTAKEKEDGKFEELYAKLEADYPDHLPLRMTNLKYVDAHKKRSEMLDVVVSAADAVATRISEDALALHFGRKSDTEDPESVKERKDMKEKKTFLIDALARMALAYADTRSDEAAVKFDETLKRLKAWIDIDSSDKYAALVIERETRAGRFGSVLKVLNKLISKESKDKDSIKTLSKSELYEKRAAIFEQLGFKVLVEYDMKARVIACPKAYALF